MRYSRAITYGLARHADLPHDARMVAPWMPPGGSRGVWTVGGLSAAAGILLHSQLVDVPPLDVTALQAAEKAASR